MTRDERIASKFRAIDRHLARVEEMVPEDRAAFAPMSAASDAVVLHLWQAIQLAIDAALHECARRRLETPPTYGAAFRWRRGGLRCSARAWVLRFGARASLTEGGNARVC